MRQVDNTELISEAGNRLKNRQLPGRTEALVQSDIRLLLLASNLNLVDGDIMTVSLESPAGGGQRIDIEIGACVIEVKRDLRVGSVQAMAEDQLKGYLEKRGERQERTYAGVLTDGVEWHLFQLEAGTLQQVSSFELEDTESSLPELIEWLRAILATEVGVEPSPEEISRRLGASSPGLVGDHTARWIDADGDGREVMGVVVAAACYPAVRHAWEGVARPLTRRGGRSGDREIRKNLGSLCRSDVVLCLWSLWASTSREAACTEWGLGAGRRVDNDHQRLEE